MSVRDRTCLVTGASSGIGLETARGLAQLGAHVLMLGRSTAKLNSAVRDIRQSTGSEQLTPITCDLGSQRAIRNAAGDIARLHPHLHVLVNNAGVYTRSRSVTEDGVETQLAVNHLGPFLLTHLLLEALRAAGAARIVNVASQVEGSGRIAFDDINGEKHYDSLAAYCQTKLANVLFTYELARRLEGSDVTVNCLHPGVVATKLLNDFSGRPRAFQVVDRLRYIGPAVGAETSVFLASSSEVEGVTGRYYRSSRVAESSLASRDVGLQRRLWNLSCQLTGLTNC